MLPKCFCDVFFFVERQREKHNVILLFYLSNSYICSHDTNLRDITDFSDIAIPSQLYDLNNYTSICFTDMKV